MKFKPVNQFYAECGEYKICQSKTGNGVAFTLSWRGEMLKVETCADYASERRDAQNELIQFAKEHDAICSKA